MAQIQGVFSGACLRIALIAAFLVIVPSSLAAPRQISPNACSPTCKTSQDAKLRYEGGKTYIYDFESESVTQLLGSSDESSDLKIKGQVVLEAQSQCDFVLTVKDATIQNPSGKVTGMETLSGTSVRFSYQDGTVEELCTAQDDPTWSANIKRGLVSMLQNQGLKNMGKSVILEADISGRCPTLYTVQGDRYIKSRDLLGCSNREDSKLLHHGIRYDLPSRTKSLPVAVSNMSCVQDMKDGIVQTVSCKESHFLNAFSQKGAGAQTTVISTLSLQSVQSLKYARSSSLSYQPSSIFYDHSATLQPVPSKSATTQTRVVLNRICAEFDSPDYSAVSADYFHQLKRAIGNIRYDDLKEIYDSIDAGSMCSKNSKTLKKMLIDAAIQSGSDGPIALVFSMFSDLEDEVKKGFYMQIAFAPRPGPLSLAAMSKLLKRQSDPDVTLLLAASGLAHQYCKNTNPVCVEEPNYVELVDVLAKFASMHCLATESAEQEKAIAALQALGNLDSLTPGAVTAIKHCMSGSERIQVRAIDASRRDPCNPSLKKNAHDVFADSTKASNVRIQGYISMTHCLEASDIDVIQNVLTAEKSNQVLSYVASHIRNKVRSAKPDKPEVYSMLNDLRLPRSAPQDMFKYSKNFEQTHIARTKDLGGALEGNLVYSSTSYVPRSASANATVYALGRAFNFLEVGVYAENFEKAIERFQKSRTTDSDRSARYVWGGKNAFVKRADSSESTPLYNIDTELEPLWTEAASPRNDRHGFSDIYIRVHGTSVLLRTLREEKFDRNTLWAKSPLKPGSRHPSNIRLTDSLSYLDEEIVYPTISGLPLKFGLSASSVFDFEISSSSTNAGFFNQDKSGSTFQAHVVPRAASLLKGRMSVAAGPVESGVQMEGKVHTTTGVDVAITNEKNNFDFKVAFPQDKIHVAEVRSDLFWVQSQPDDLDKKTPVKTKAQQKVYAKSTRPNDCYASEILGLKLCADISYPQPLSSGPQVPLLGTSIVAVAIEKTDASMEGYHVQVSSQFEGTNRHLNAFIDTPGSKTNRKVQLRGSLVTEDILKAQLDLDSPWKRASLNYQQENTDVKKAANLAFSLDEEEYKVSAQVDISGSGSKKVYKPLVKYSTPSRSHNILAGSIQYSPKKRVVATIETDVGDFKYLNGKANVDSQFDFDDASDNYSIVNNFALDYPEWGLGKISHESTLKYVQPTWDLTTQNTFLESAEKSATNWKVTHIPSQRWEIHGASKCSYFDMANYHLDWTVTKDKKTSAIENTFSFNHLKAYKGQPLTIKQHSKYDTSTKHGFNVVNELTVKAQDLDLDFLLNGKHIVDQSHEYQLRAHAGGTHKVDFKIVTGPEIDFNYNVIASLQYPGQYYEYTEVAKQTGDYTWRYDTHIVQRPGSVYDVVAELVTKDERNNMEKSFTATIKSDKWSQPRVFTTSLKKENIGISALLQYESQGQKQVNIATSYKQIGLKPDTLKMVAFVRDYVDAKLTGTRSRSTSTLELLGKWVPTGRAIKADSEYKTQGERMTVKGEILWDAERDPTQMARLNSNTLFTSSSSFESNNEINFLQRTSNLDMKVKRGRGIMDGEHLLDAVYKDSTDVNYKVYLQHVGDTKPRAVSSKLVAKSQYMNDAPYELELENRFGKFDSSHVTFEVLTDLKAVASGETQLQFHAEANSLYPPGSVRTMAGNFDVSGSAVPTPFTLEYDTEYKGAALKTTVNGKYGKKTASLALSGKFDRFATKKTAELSYQLSLPFYPQSVSGTQKYTYIFDSLNHMEVSESGSLSIDNHVPLTWMHMLHSMSNDYKVVSTVSKEGSTLWNIGVSGRKQSKRVSLDFVGKVKGHGMEFHSSVDGKFPYYNIRSNGSYLASDAQKGYGYNLNHRNAQGGQSIVTDISIDHSGEKFALSNKLENYAKRKSIDLLFTDGSVPRKLYVLLLNNAPKWSVESYAKWGEAGNTLSTKGSVEYTADLFDAAVSIDSPRLHMDKWSARASQKTTRGRKSLAVSIEGKNQQILTLGMDYAKKVERSGEIYDGSVNIAASKSRYSGSFRVENARFSKKRDGEDGGQIQGMITLQGGDSPMKFNVSMKSTDLERQLFLSYCTNGESQCRSGDLSFTHEHEDQQNVRYELRATTESTQPGKQATIDGITFKTVKSGQDFTHEANVIVRQRTDKPLGYKVHKKAGKEFGIDINLPERVISGILVRTSKPGHEQAELNLWTDKTRKADEKLSIVLTYDAIDEAKDGAHGGVILYEVKHPSLPQNMKVWTKLVYGGRNVIFNFNTDVAMFKQGSKLSWFTKLTREESSGEVYKFVSNVNSQEPVIKAQLYGEYRDTNGQTAFIAETTYTDAQRESKEAKLYASYGKTDAQLKVSINGQQPVVSWTANWTGATKYGNSVYNVRQNILFPGMSESRNVEMQLHTASMPHANMKVYKNGATKGDFLEAFVGFQSDLQFTAGVYTQEAGVRETLGDLNLALNSSRLLFVKLDWETRNVDKALTYAQGELKKVGKAVKESVRVGLNEAANEVESVVDRFTDALPDFTPVMQVYKKEFKSIRDELKNNSETKAIRQYLENAESLLDDYFNWVNDFVDFMSESLIALSEQIAQFIRALPRLLEDAKKFMPEWFKTVQEFFYDMIDSFVAMGNSIMEEIKAALRQIQLPNGGHMLDFLNDTSDGIGKLTRQVVDATVEIFTLVANEIRSFGSRLMENSEIKDYAMQLLSRYESWLARIIETVKDRSEYLRESLLSRFPQKEMQEFILAVFEYASKKANNIDMNDTAARKDIYNKFVQALKKTTDNLWTVDLKNGLILAQIPLPKPLGSFKETPQYFPTFNFDFLGKHWLDQIIETVGAWAETSDSYVSNELNNVLTMGITNPLQSYALLVGSEYIRTFDGKFYHFEGHCRYVLASDFSDRNFTIAIDYNGQNSRAQKSIIINYGNYQSVIKPDFSVEVNKVSRSSEAQGELVAEDLTDYVSVRSTDDLLSVTCSKKQDSCIFSLSKLYHSKTKGLFGNFNNEHHDDFHSTGGDIVDKVENFVKYWKLDATCEEKPISSATQTLKKTSGHCADAFAKKSSSLSNCFDHLNPAQFQQICEAMEARTSSTTDALKPVCATSVAYSQACAKQYRFVQPLPVC